MPDKVAVIASVLKPVDDTRMYEKLGHSIRESNKYRVNIIGFDTKKPVDDGSVSFYPLYKGGRTGWRRITAGWQFYRKLKQLKPDLIIICSPELLPAAAWYKVWNGGRLWYDVQENYQWNIRYQSAYPALLKPFLSVMIALIEHGTRPLIDHYLLAERGYLKELGFAQGKCMVLENKFVPLAMEPTGAISESQSRLQVLTPNIYLTKDRETNPGTTSQDGNRQPNSDIKHLVFTGTCSKENGILEALELTTRLIQQGLPVQMKIVGQVPDPNILKIIRTMQVSYDEGTIELIGDGQLVPHQTIMECAATADFGLVAHQPNPSNENCIPTKIYEYLGLRIPMIIQKHPLWESVVELYQAATVIEYQNIDPDALWEQLANTVFYTKEPGPEITWKQEAERLRGKIEMMNDE